MATVRQPFAPLDGVRLQTLTSLKNRQNAVASPIGKRKAELIDTDDAENVDPVSKRPKGQQGLPQFPAKPTAYLLKATPDRLPAKTSLTSPRRTLQPTSRIAKLNTKPIQSSPIAAPAGRSPTRGKRSGILRRRTLGPCRVDPPSFNGGAPFSLDAALKGTIPSYVEQKAEAPPALSEPDMKASWFFDIHEDTPEQEMTNLLQHGTCVLDISSDEESERKATRDRAEGRDKENVPPVDDVSQTRRARDETMDGGRVALGEMKTAEFFAEGCDEASVILVPEDEIDETPADAEASRASISSPVDAIAPVDASTPTDANDAPHIPIVDDFEFAPELKSAPSLPADLAQASEVLDVDMLMSRETDSSKAAVLQPVDGTGESFDLWESGSAKGEGEAEVAAVES